MIGSRSLTCLTSVVIGHSPGMVDLMRAAVRIANTKASVLIRGEGGTGREQLARFLHLRSGRADRPFVEISCASLGHHLAISSAPRAVTSSMTSCGGDFGATSTIGWPSSS